MADGSESEKKLVLIGEDDPDCQMFMKIALNDYSFIEMKIFENGQTLIDYLETTGLIPALVILDLKMPEKDGKQTLNEIRSNPQTKDITVVILTTSSLREDLEDCEKLGADAFCTKPNSYRELVETLRKLVEDWVMPSRS